MQITKPKFPVEQLTTYELRDFRSELEEALPSAPEGSEDHKLISENLRTVVTEQDARAAAALKSTARATS